MPAHNTTAVDPDDLLELRSAFRAVLAGEAEYDETDGVRAYTFESFRLLTRH